MLCALEINSLSSFNKLIHFVIYIVILFAIKAATAFKMAGRSREAVLSGIKALFPRKF